MDYFKDLDNKARMLGQKVYFPNDPEIAAAQLDALEVLYDYNATRPHDTEKRAQIMKKLFAEVGDGCYIEPPLHANWGIHTHLGDNVYANFNLTLVDDTDIFIGDGVMLAPNVVIATAGHPILPFLRIKQAQYNLPVHIGNNVWVGANSVILPGVTIGDNSVIGAGSVVTRDIPANVVAFGNPCRVAREIGERDKKYFFRDLEIDIPLDEND